MSATGYILSCLIQLRVPVMKLPVKSPESELIKCQVSDYGVRAGGGEGVSILSEFQYLKQTQNI